MSHIPVLMNEMLDALCPQNGEVYVDATFGGGGYSRAILEAANCQVIALDRDPNAIEIGKTFEDEFEGRFKIMQGTFSQLKDLLESQGLEKVDGFIFDLGVSSYQLDTPERGFSFRNDGPLDMRMSSEGISAEEVVNTFSEKELADIIYKYGEERRSRAIARKIVAVRQAEPIQTTRQLAELIQAVVKAKKKGQNPATLTFQALRIFVNNELIEIDKGLKIAEECLCPGGRLVVVTFHSLEDRLVKQFLKVRLVKGRPGKGQPRNRNIQGGLGSSYQSSPSESEGVVATFEQRTGTYLKGVTPCEAELRSNPRARSARLRTATRLSVQDQSLDSWEEKV